ncbi:MAG: hypothetical protein HY719_15990 [Planctomycetes bacterium]|nr:hypothetical protein [Planctomycetota bacterium]
MDPLSLAILLLIVAVALFIIEVFVPSGGLIPVGGLVAAGFALYHAFSQGVMTGLIFAAGGLTATVAGVSLAFRVLPRTSLGKRLLLVSETRPADELRGDALDLSRLLGCEGRTASPLRPSGVAVFGDYRVSVVTQGELVAADAVVEVIEVAGNRVVVRAARGER